MVNIKTNLFKQYLITFTAKISLRRVLQKSILPVAFFISFILLPQSLYSQVTIGSGTFPQNTSLLQLKEYEPDVDNTTSTKGFLISRVKLTSLTSLSPMISAENVTADDMKNNIGLQIYHVGGNNIAAGIKVWNGSAWSDLDNSGLKVSNGINYNNDTIQLGGSLVKPTQLLATVSGANLEYRGTADNSNMLITGNAKLGVNTVSPMTTVDINGDLAVRAVSTRESGMFNDIGVDAYGKVFKRNDSFTSYSVYLGYDPMSLRHTDTIPLTLQEGYIYINLKGCQ